MADNNNNHLPIAIIHRIPTFKFPTSWATNIFNPIELSDPSYPTHRLSARILIVFALSPLKPENLDLYPSLECVIGTSAGVDHIDLAECRSRNIRVTSAGGAFSEDGADYAIGLLIDVMRRVSASDRFVRAGLWPVQGDYPLRNTARGKKGIIVNIGRGPLEDEKELVKFLVEGELRGAGFDLFGNELEVPKRAIFA